MNDDSGSDSGHSPTTLIRLDGTFSGQSPTSPMTAATTTSRKQHQQQQQSRRRVQGQTTISFGGALEDVGVTALTSSSAFDFINNSSQQRRNDSFIGVKSVPSNSFLGSGRMSPAALLLLSSSGGGNNDNNPITNNNSIAESKTEKKKRLDANVLLLRCVARGYLARYRLYRRQERQKSDQAAALEFSRRTANLSHVAVQSAMKLVRRFVLRWHAKHVGKKNFEKHMMWLTNNNRLLTQALDADPTNGEGTWSRPRDLVSWSLYSAPTSPYVSSPATQRWLSGVVKYMSAPIRRLQKWWKRTRFQRAAHTTQQLLLRDRKLLVAASMRARLALLISELRARADMQSQELIHSEEMARVECKRQAEVDKSHAQQRQALTVEEAQARISSLRSPWDEWMQCHRVARCGMFEFKEKNARRLLEAKSLLRLMADIKECWWTTSVIDMATWLEVSCLHVEAERAHIMSLCTSDLVDVSHIERLWGSNAGRQIARVKQITERRPLAMVEGPGELCVLVDRWYPKLVEEEDAAWADLNEQFGRRMLRLRLDRMPFEEMMLAQERSHRAVLVQQMLKALPRRPRPPPRLMDMTPKEYGEAAFVELHPKQQPPPQPPLTAVVVSPLTPAMSTNSGSNNRSISPSFVSGGGGGGVTAAGLAETVVIPPWMTGDLVMSKTMMMRVEPGSADANNSNGVPRPKRFGRDGFQTGISTALQRAMGGVHRTEQQVTGTRGGGRKTTTAYTPAAPGVASSSLAQNGRH